MLKKRVITATILAIVLIADTFLSSTGFMISMAVLVGLAAREWARLSGYATIMSQLAYVAINIGALYGVTKLPTLLVLQIVCVFWLVALIFIMTYPRSIFIWSAKTIRAAMGIIILTGMGLAFLVLHAQLNGAWLILSLWGMVALADIGAYFVGHAIGQRKLALNVSPGKTQEGALGGILIASVSAGIASFIYTQSLPNAVQCAGVAAVVAIASIVGDLFESMLKRFCGVKDSGRLLPGHGGVLDRIDGWTAAAPFYALIVVSFQVVIV